MLYIPTMMLAVILSRKTWGLLLITGLGFVAAVMLACAVPLYSDVSMTAGLRGALTSSSANANIVVQSFAEQINQQKIDGTTYALNQEFKGKLGPYLSSPQFTIQTSVLPIDTKILSSHGSVTFKDTDNQLQLFGSTLGQSASHLTLLQGRLPKTVSTAATNDDLEIALSDESARSLNVALGSVIYMKVALVYIPTIREEHILRSRGASRSQIFGSLVTQSVGLGLVALILGPSLAIVMVRLIARNVLPPTNQSALSIISGSPIQVVLGILWYALITILIAIMAMIVAVSRTTRQDVLSIRREAVRSTRLPLWQRLNLDIVAAIIMIVGYSFSYYVINAGILDPHLTLLLLSPMTLVGAVFLLIAGLLLFLRFFPYFLQFGSWLTAQIRSAPPMLALAQMSRAPRHSVRLTLLLALATAFAIFTIIFTASQTQRIEDVAAYQSGADFSGTFQNDVATPLQVTEETALYHNIPGVISATVGNISSVTAAGTILSIPMEIRAVDSTTFARTAIWTEQDSSQPLSTLMSQLIARRASALSRQTVPAVVDSSAWQSLKLTPTATSFSLNFTNGTVQFVAIAEVQHIPTVNDLSTSITNSSSIPNGGILVDYQSLAAVYGYDFKASSASLPLNAVWLRTRDDAASLTAVRTSLTKGVLQLSPLYDRRETIESLYHDPLYLDLIGVMTLGAATALLLALVGNLIATWLSARSLLVNFAVLRALGAASPQIASTLTWEQSIIYSTAILLGILFGAVFSVLVVPRLIFTSVGSSGISSDLTNNQFYVTQSVPPIQIVIPPLLVVALAIIVIICVVALGIMVRVVSRPSISQTLRLNED